MYHGIDWKYELLKTQKYKENKYLDKYVELINKSESKSDEKMYKNNHHIIPFHLLKEKGISINDSLYLKSLKISNHVLAHYYLFKCSADKTEEHANINAINLLLNKIYTFNEIQKLTLKELKIIAKSRDLVTENIQEVNSFKNKGKIYINKEGKTKKIYPEELFFWLSKDWRKGGLPFSEEHKQKLRKKKPMSSEAKKRLKGRGAGKIVINLDGKYKHIYKEELNNYLNLGWKLGGRKHTDDEKNHLSNLNKGKHISEEHKYILKQKYKGYVTMYKDDLEKHVYQNEVQTYLNAGWNIGRCEKNKLKIKQNQGKNRRG